MPEQLSHHGGPRLGVLAGCVVRATLVIALSPSTDCRQDNTGAAISFSVRLPQTFAPTPWGSAARSPRHSGTWDPERCLLRRPPLRRAPLARPPAGWFWAFPRRGACPYPRRRETPHARGSLCWPVPPAPPASSSRQ